MAKRKSKDEKVVDKFLPESVKMKEETTFANLPFPENRRIRDCGEARQLYTQLYLENQLRAQSWGQVRNQLEGGRPFDPAQLQRNGESWRTNVNFRDAEAAFNRAVAPYWKKVHEVPRIASITLHSQAPQADKWGTIMAEMFNRFVDDCAPKYQTTYRAITSDLVKYGIGYPMWPDAKTPRYKHVSAIQMYFPRRTKACVEDWELVCCKREMTADQLIEKVRDQKQAQVSKDAGWNEEAIMAAIKLASPPPGNTRYFDPNFWQDMIVANDLIIGGIWPPVPVIDMWAKERDGKIRHFIFTEKADVQEYLYCNYEEAENFKQIFGAIFYDVGENELLHTIKGFAVKNYYYMTTINRTKCRIVDGATFAMSMNFTRDENTPEESPPVEAYSGINVFPKGVNQLQFYPQLGDAKEVLAMLQQNENENNYTYSDAGMRQNIANTQTKGQADLIAAIGGDMETANDAIYLSQVGANILTEQIRRLCLKGNSDPDAKKFQQRCKEAGVPDDALFKIERTVKTGASPNMASAAARQQIGAQMMQMLYPLPRANKPWIEEFVANNMLGTELSANALLPEGTQSEPGQRRAAMMENTDLGQGMPLPVAPEDAHEVHADEHLKPLEAAAQATQQGKQITPDHLMAFQIALPHIGQHLDALSHDETKKAAFKQLKARTHMVASVAQGLISRLSRAHQTAPGNPQAAQQAMMPPAA
jgi:hypothetical protein